jgi:glycine cleavage system H lipoate-binding protein
MKRPTSSAREQREPTCIWVSAGVLNYHLCDRSFECEGCELFHALTGGGRHAFGAGDGPESRRSLAATLHGEAGGAAWADDQVTYHLGQVLGDSPLYLDRLYRPPHFWVVDEGDGMVRLGLAGHLLCILNPIDEIVTPGIGLHLRRDQLCGWITRNDKAISLAMPVSGVVRGVNDPASALRVHRLGSGDAWLLRVEADEPLSEASDLIQGEEAVIWYLDRIRVLKRHLRDAVSSWTADRLGPLMADGGARNPCLEEVLGPARFQRLLEEIV